jgi:hypothetical protein
MPFFVSSRKSQTGGFRPNSQRPASAHDKQKFVAMKKSGSTENAAESRITQRIKELGDWRGETLARMRKLIKEADAGVIEEWKWVKPTHPGTPVWSHDGIVCTGESYKDKVKLTFAKGAALNDPARLFNASLDGNLRRAIDIGQGEKVDGPAFKALFRQAVALNGTGKTAAPKKKAASKAKAQPKSMR